ncbi:MAG: helix-turn-helix transcriptional regulator [Paludibaculum sp.]
MVWLVRINPAALRGVFRERSGMTVAWLAEAAGIKQAHLSNIEGGRRQASPDVVIALAKALKVEASGDPRRPHPGRERSVTRRRSSVAR